MRRTGIKTMTKAEVKKRIAGLGEGQQKEMVCVLVGHSRILEFCFGYHHCARCMALLGDSLAGSYQDNNAVYPSHLGRKIKGCNCAENAKAMTWRDTFKAPTLESLR